MVVRLHLADRDCGKCNKGVFDSHFPILTRGMDKLRLNFYWAMAERFKAGVSEAPVG